MLIICLIQIHRNSPRAETSSFHCCISSTYKSSWHIDNRSHNVYWLPLDLARPYLLSFCSQNNPIRQLLLSLSYKWGNWSLEKLNNCLQEIRLLSGKGRLISKSVSLTPVFWTRTCFVYRSVHAFAHAAPLSEVVFSEPCPAISEWSPVPVLHGVAQFLTFPWVFPDSSQLNVCSPLLSEFLETSHVLPCIIVVWCPSCLLS